MNVMTYLFPAPASLETGQEKTLTWRFFWPVLLVAFALRLVFARWADLPLHPDETYQYYEQAYRLVHGYGLIPWEYVFGIRSWLIPLSLAGLLVVADALGLDQPDEYAFFLKTVLSLISLSLPIAMYRLGQVLWNEQAAIFSLLLGSFWHHFLYVAHKPMPGILAMYGLVWLILLMVRPQTRARMFAFGLLLGLVFALRYQLVPVLGLLWLIALYRLRGAALGLMLAGNALALALAGGLDWIFWGGFLSSFIDNFRLNFLYDIASNFGEQEALFYAKRLLVETGGLFAFGLIGVALLWPRIWPVALALAIGVLAFHIPAHKELRFVLWILPLALIGAAVLTAWLGARGARWNIAAPLLLCLWAGAVTVGFSARYLGVLPWQPTLRDGAAVMHALGRSPDVTGVDFRTPSLPWWHTPGYYALGKPVPLYLWGWDPDLPEATRLAHASHIVTEAGSAAPEGYTQISRHGMFTLWQSQTPKADIGLEGFPLKTPLYPAPIPPDYKTVGRRTPLMLEGW